MRLRIVAEDGSVFAECEVGRERPWRDLVAFIAKQWEAEAQADTGLALAALLEAKVAAGK